MTTDTALVPSTADAPISAAQLRSRLSLIQEVMKSVMQENSDFGTIPGTPKPTLYKPGAEKLCVTFRLAPDQPIIESLGEPGEIHYRVTVPIRSSNGTIVAVGVGECSSGEEKYRWRRPVHENEWKAAPEDQRREKWQRDGKVWKQVRVNPADVANTILKMAHKRAYVHGTIMATAAGAIFTQDVEDMPEGMDTQDERPSGPAAPQERGQAPANGDTITEPQRKRLFAVANKHGWEAAALKTFLGTLGVASTTEIRRDQYDDIIAAVECGPGNIKNPEAQS